MMNTLFATATESNALATNARSLNGTAQLTQLSMNIATESLQTIAGENSPVSEAEVKATLTDHNAMDALLVKLGHMATADIEFLKQLSNEELESMLKSQQSKRSRSKGKVMTKENYMTMMVGAIAENLVRQALGKEKQLGGRVSGSASYTAEELDKLALDQDQLRRVLRNVQSKKSIMKSKEGFSENDDRWKELLATEAQLKSLRNEVIRVDETKEALTAIFRETDYTTLNKSQLTEFVAKIEALIVPYGPDVTEISDPQNFNAAPPTATEDVA